ncbi:hypothetical protein JCM10908_000106 [Rhodotorula pacifica]|uniref:uncharacterized protein n=1 Tax=Rhodotorula pacifica TaxID=1495444 RepID=UPI00316C0E25
MSFQDLERGVRDQTSTPSLRPADTSEDPAFRALARRVSVQVQKISANTAAISKLIELLGTPRDNPTLRTRLHDLQDSTREVLKSSTGDVKQLGDWRLPTDKPQLRQEQQKVSADFQRALKLFQATSRHSAERQRLYVQEARARVGQDHERLQQTRPRVSEADVDFQEQLIQEREGEIEQIEQGITELNQIFKDLGQIVGEQQSMIDNIETNVISVARDTHGASEQLTQAHAYQRKAGRRMFCLLLVFLLVLAVVLLAVLS